MGFKSYILFCVLLSFGGLYSSDDTNTLRLQYEKMLEHQKNKGKDTFLNNYIYSFFHHRVCATMFHNRERVTKNNFPKLYTMSEDIAKKLDVPFLAPEIIRLNWVQRLINPVCDVMAYTDGDIVAVGERLIRGLSVEELNAVLAHEYFACC